MTADNTGVHLNVNTEAETDYEFMFFAKRYGFDQTQLTASWTTSLSFMLLMKPSRTGTSFRS